MSRSPLVPGRCRVGIATVCAVLALTASGGVWGSEAGQPYIVVSLSGHTLRLEPGRGRGLSRVFPVGVGRVTPRGQSSPLGTLFTGPDPLDRERYLPSRWLPAFHRGLPFLRLDRAQAGSGGQGQVSGLNSIHGPVSPTLIWGQVSRGCVRMHPRHIREVYQVASRNPTLPVTFIRGPDLVQGRPVVPQADLPAVPGCPEAALGVRRLRRLTPGRSIHDRICGGVDHWYALTLAGGETVSVELSHDGFLLVELFGIKAISAIAAGAFGLKHTLPPAHHNRGERYIRVLQRKMGRATGVRQGGPRPYVLLVNLL